VCDVKSSSCVKLKPVQKHFLLMLVAAYLGAAAAPAGKAKESHCYYFRWLSMEWFERFVFHRQDLVFVMPM
jgi:hypothetical protein